MTIVGKSKNTYVIVFYPKAGWWEVLKKETYKKDLQFQPHYRERGKIVEEIHGYLSDVIERKALLYKIWEAL